MHKRWVAAETTGSSTLPYAPCHIIRDWQTESRLHVTEHRNGKDVRQEAREGMIGGEEEHHR